MQLVAFALFHSASEKDFSGAVIISTYLKGFIVSVTF